MSKIISKVIEMKMKIFRYLIFLIFSSAAFFAVYYLKQPSLIALVVMVFYFTVDIKRCKQDVKEIFRFKDSKEIIKTINVCLFVAAFFVFIFEVGPEASLKAFTDWKVLLLMWLGIITLGFLRLLEQ